MFPIEDLKKRREYLIKNGIDESFDVRWKEMKKFRIFFAKTINLNYLWSYEEKTITIT